MSCIKSYLQVLACWISVCGLYSCDHEKPKLFQLLPSQQTGIDYTNAILETDSFNIMTEEFIYNGAGVGVGDFNNDGLPDLFFSGNEVANKLYLNQGEMEFLDVTAISGLGAADKWSTGVSVVDINGDGRQDIYVAAAMKKDSLDRANMLFVNQGLDENGIPVFLEMASAFGIDDRGYSMSATFFDYNQDGLLDLYVLNNLLVTSLPGVFRDKITDGSAGNNDRLYRNNGDGTFSDVSQEAGIRIEGYGLGLAISDFNADGWPDIYVSNDYLSNDILYLNNGDGTFSNRIEDFIRHQSHFSMGVDIADINNDGLQDIVTLDMLAESNFRMKSTISQNSYQKYINNERWGFEYQYVRNMLHLNNGYGIPFSEIGFLSGIYQTDWSWSPLLVDMDNDGFRDLLVTNGYPRDVTDKDFTNFRADMGTVATTRMLLDSIPIVKIPNYAFRNNGNLTFSNSSREWGLDLPSFSNGAAYVDLDLDGDLDYVVSNINQEAFVFENLLNDSKKEKSNFLRLKLKGTSNNHQGLGAKIKVALSNGGILYHEQYTGRGYMSSVEDIVHFGLGEASTVESLEILWPDGRWQKMDNVPLNRVFLADIKNATDATSEELSFFMQGTRKEPPLKEMGQEVGLAIKHQERDVVDFNVQRTLPHKLSQFGPGLAVGDLNGDGLEDLLMGGSAGYPRQLMFQKEDGTFDTRSFPLTAENLMEDMGLLLFDWDNDGDLDLYAVSGSSEYALGNEVYQDRMYENDGNGHFSLLQEVLPKMSEVGTVVRAADFDGDGYLDLFIGGRSGQGQYPMPGKSFLLRNNGGKKWVDVAESLAPGLKEIGMVTDALWTDVDSDGLVDLMVVGEFMAITIFKNVGGKLKLLENTGLEKHVGWWNSITAADFDGDGDMDYLVGNLGQNNFYQVSEKRPLTLYAGDFDKNQSIDPVFFAYFKDEQGKFKQFPVHFWVDLYGQSTLFRKRFSNFKAYARAGLSEVLTPEETSTAEKLEASQMSSSYLENLGNGKFNLKPLPLLAQTAPIFGMIATDLDNDGHMDVLMVGNDYGNEVFSGRMDALVGLWLQGDGNGGFKALLPEKSGFLVAGDGKSLVQLMGAGKQMLYMAGQNRDSLRVFGYQKSRNSERLFFPEPDDFTLWIHTREGDTLRRELYHGSGFLSQSTRWLSLPENTMGIRILNFSGDMRDENNSLGN